MADLITTILLALSNIAHLLATVIWIGGLTTFGLAVTPSAEETLSPPMMGKLFGSVMKRFRPLVYFSILAFLFSGIAMTYLNENYTGLLDLSTNWAVVSVIKHVAVGIFMVLAVYNFEVFAPKLAAVAAKGPSPELARLQTVQKRSAKIGLLVAVIILIITGISTAL
ncbi:MAG: DUF4149 domain-containing protein [Candidatus Hodarchaeales archaeon]